MGTSVIRADGLSKDYGAVPALRNLTWRSLTAK